MLRLFINFYNFILAIRDALKDSEFRILLFLACLTVGIGTLFYHFYEGWGFIDSLYFCVVTLTTVGFGDMAPSDGTSKLFTTVYLIIGLGIFLLFINSLSAQLIKANLDSIKNFKKR
jgi:voltage-gated potassium channel Kch